MRLINANYALLSIFIFFQFSKLVGEGFCHATLVQIPDGYTKIENLRIGDRVICYDAAKNHVEGLISSVIKKSINQYVRIHVADQCICAAGEQQLYDERTDSWITTGSLKTGDVLAGHVITVQLIDEQADVYLIGVAQHHNFFVLPLHICAHNFVPVVVVGISVLFGGGLEIAGVTCGVAGLGGYLGYRWHKKNKQKHDIAIQTQLIRFDSVQKAEDTYHTNDAQAPGMPTENDGYCPPKKWDGRKVKNPNGGGFGYPDKKGHIWVPTGPKEMTKYGYGYQNN